MLYVKAYYSRKSTFFKRDDSTLCDLCIRHLYIHSMLIYYDDRFLFLSGGYQFRGIDNMDGERIFFTEE